MPTAEQMYNVLREGLTDEELKNVSESIDRLLAAYDRIATTHTVNPALVQPTEKEEGVGQAH